jgi:hypothetical protein
MENKRVSALVRYVSKDKTICYRRYLLESEKSIEGFKFHIPEGYEITDVALFHSVNGITRAKPFRIYIPASYVCQFNKMDCVE